MADNNCGSGDIGYEIRNGVARVITSKNGEVIQVVTIPVKKINYISWVKSKKEVQIVTVANVTITTSNVSYESFLNFEKDFIEANKTM